MSMSAPRLLFLVACSSLVAGCSTFTDAPPLAQAQLQPRSYSRVSGSVSFAPRGDAVLVVAHVTDLTPGEHGFHIHEGGDCSAEDASSAKGHFNPGGMMHGHPRQASQERHVGDLPNLVADSNGVAVYRQEVKGLQLDAGPNGILGRSVVVHAAADDYHSQPAGNSGRRVACGVIEKR
ncbi:MAG: hypothetical protein RJA36_2547 [Pseudomonadota bacterium]|jgi:Cu-Zn family superoxide dismutase